MKYRIYRLKQKKLLRIVMTYLIKKGLIGTDAIVLDNIIVPKEFDTDDMYSHLQKIHKNINNMDIHWLPTESINFMLGLKQSKINIGEVEIYDLEIVNY